MSESVNKNINNGKFSWPRLGAMRLLAILAFLTSIAYGQEVRGTVTGLVTDPQGGALVGTRVEIKGLDTNVLYPATTNESGLYVVPFLPPGNYSVAASHTGFKRA